MLSFVAAARQADRGAIVPHAHHGARRCLLAGAPRDELATFSTRRRAMGVDAVHLRPALSTTANEFAMRHRMRGARVLDSSTSPIVRIGYRAPKRDVDFCVARRVLWGIVMCVLDVSIA